MKNEEWELISSFLIGSSLAFSILTVVFTTLQLLSQVSISSIFSEVERHALAVHRSSGRARQSVISFVNKVRWLVNRENRHFADTWLFLLYCTTFALSFYQPFLFQKAAVCCPFTLRRGMLLRWQSRNKKSYDLVIGLTRPGVLDCMGTSNALSREGYT